VNKKEEEEEEIFDVFSSYLEKIENTKKRKEKSNLETPEHKKIGLKETFREIVNLAKKERVVLGVVMIEIILTFILVLMFAGFLPLF